MHQRLGQLSAVAGGAAILLVLLLVLSVYKHDGVSGPLTWAASQLIPSAPAAAQELKPVGYFAVYEERLRLWITVASILVAIAAGVLAMYSARASAQSAWYSIGVLAGAAAMCEIGLIWGVTFLVIFGTLTMHSRRWKMSAQ